VDQHRRFGFAKQQILIIVSVAGAFAWLITTSGYPQQLVGFVENLQLKNWMLLLITNTMVLFVGSILESPAATLLLTPLVTPIFYAAGVDPIQFGIIVTVNLAIGTFMPPFGLNLFAAHALFRMPLPELCRGVMPFQYGDVDSYHLCAGDHARLAVSAQVSWSGKTDTKTEYFNVPMRPLAET
jgi:TRAP-type C4-dicarboxylate transport system permease large subunit